MSLVPTRMDLVRNSSSANRSTVEPGAFSSRMSVCSFINPGTEIFDGEHGQLGPGAIVMDSPTRASLTAGANLGVEDSVLSDSPVAARLAPEGILKIRHANQRAPIPATTRPIIRIGLLCCCAELGGGSANGSGARTSRCKVGLCGLGAVTTRIFLQDTHLTRPAGEINTVLQNGHATRNFPACAGPSWAIVRPEPQALQNRDWRPTGFPQAEQNIGEPSREDHSWTETGHQLVCLSKFIRRKILCDLSAVRFFGCSGEKPKPSRLYLGERPTGTVGQAGS